MLRQFYKNWPFFVKLRLFLGLILLILIFLFLLFKVVPGGEIIYTRDYDSWFKTGKGFIYGFTPAERVDLKSGTLPRLVGDPIYFSVFTPRTFDQAKLVIVYQNHLSSSTPIVEAGVLVDKLVWRYELKPIQNKILDNLRFKWSRLEDSSTENSQPIVPLLILQAEKNYTNSKDFKNDLKTGKLTNCPGGIFNCLAIYNYSLNTDYQIPNYQPARPLIIDTPLRGALQFYVYLNNEALRLDFELVDLNQAKDPDPITAILYAGDKIIASETLEDSQQLDTSGKLRSGKLSLNKSNLPTGVYKVEIKASDDIVVKKIASSLDRLSFINKVWPVTTAKPVTLYTDANYLQVKAYDPASLQTIKFGGQDFALNEAYEQFTFETKANLAVKEIKISRDDLILETSGVFSFSSSSLFNPNLKKIDRYFSPDTDASYVVASYESPRTIQIPGGALKGQEFKVSSVEFDLKTAYRENGRYSFMISVPGLKIAGDNKNYLEIKEIRLELRGRTLWQKIFQ